MKKVLLGSVVAGVAGLGLAFSAFAGMGGDGPRGMGMWQERAAVAAAVCEGDRAANIAAIEANVIEGLALSEEQQGKLAALVQGLQDNPARLDRMCDRVAAGKGMAKREGSGRKHGWGDDDDDDRKHGWDGDDDRDDDDRGWGRKKGHHGEGHYGRERHGSGHKRGGDERGFERLQNHPALSDEDKADLARIAETLKQYRDANGPKAGDMQGSGMQGKGKMRGDRDDEQRGERGAMRAAMGEFMHSLSPEQHDKLRAGGLSQFLPKP